MTKVSRFKMEQKLEKKLVANLWNLLGRADRDEVGNFLGNLLTTTEILMFAKRLEILRRLYRKESYSKIKTDLKVTSVTVAKMSNLLHRAGSEFLAILTMLD